MKIANRKTIVREIIKIGAVMSEHLKITHGLHLSTTNRDVILKGALIMNFVCSIPLINDFSSVTNDKIAWENDYNRFAKILFEGSNLEMNKCLEMVCDKSESDIHNRSFAFLVHSNQERCQNQEEKYRDTYKKAKLPPAPPEASASPSTAPLPASGMPITPNTAQLPGHVPTPNQMNIAPYKIVYEWDGQAYIPTLMMTTTENGQQPQKDGGAPPSLLSPLEE